MLKPQDIVIHYGRGVGGDFLQVVHTPTGITRGTGPPLPKPGKARQEALRQIEADLIERGFTQYLLPDRRFRR
jgi:hypothetical protein